MSDCGINPQTGRCVNNGRKNTRDCTRDLKTKRCRKNQAQKKQPKKAPKTPDKTQVNKCKEGYMLNPATKRCISKTGNIAKKIQVTKDTTTIGGPVTISYYEIEFGGITKKFLLFGDLHIQYGFEDDPNTITITTLMKKLIRQCPHCVDLFVERGVEQIYQVQIEDSDEFEDQQEDEEYERAWAEYTKYKEEEEKKKKTQQAKKAKKKKTKQTAGRLRPLNKHSSPLQAVRDEFGSCPVTITLHKCPFDNLRYHNWDLRNVSGDHPRLLWGTGIANWYQAILEKYWSHPTMWKHITAEDMIKYLLGFDIGNTRVAIDKIFDSIFDFNVTKWETQGKLTIMRKRKKYQKHMEMVIQRAYKKMVASLPDFPKDFLDTFIQVYAHSVNSWVPGFSIIFTDFYLVCRMFKKFSTLEGKSARTPKRCPTTEKQRKKTSQPMTYETPQYIMMYAGARHSAYVGKFLEEMFSVKPLYSHQGCKKYLLKKNKLPKTLLEAEKMQQMTLSDIKFSRKFKKPDNIMGLFAPFVDS